MGFLDNDNPQTELLNDQIREQKAELEAKKHSLFQTRLDIIKSTGGQQWHPSPNGGGDLGRVGGIDASMGGFLKTK